MNKTVLIIEDEKILQDVYKLILTTKGYKVYTANNGLEGIASMERFNPDVVLLDIYMPLMSGREMLRKINLGRFPRTKVIVYSNLSDPETEEEVLQNGAEKFVLKSSMTPQDLTDLIEAMTHDYVGVG